MSTVNAAPLRIDDIRPAGVAPHAPAASATGAGPAAGESVSFWDFLDVINPLQHLPVIGHLYRELTGDEIKPASRVVGGFLFGGAIGAGAAVATMAAEEVIGVEKGETLISTLFGGDDAGAGAGAGAGGDAAGGSQLAAGADTAGQAPEQGAALEQIARLTMRDNDLPMPPSRGAQADPALPQQDPEAGPEELIAAYATPEATGGAAGDLVAQAAPAGPATAGAGAIAAGSDARFFPMAARPAAAAETQVAAVAAETQGAAARGLPPRPPQQGFMAIRPEDFRSAGALPPRPPVPESRIAGVPSQGTTAATSTTAASARPALPASAGLLSRPPAETAAATAETAAAPASAPPAAVQRALEMQGVDPAEAAAHPMIAALGRTPAATPAQTSAATATATADTQVGAATGATAAESLAAAQGAGPVEMPGWFDAAMMRALDRYEKTGRLSEAAAASPAGPTRVTGA